MEISCKALPEDEKQAKKLENGCIICGTSYKRWDDVVNHFWITHGTVAHLYKDAPVLKKPRAKGVKFNPDNGRHRAPKSDRKRRFEQS
jgi:hypothetical protein